jgi:hypothetical protein
MLYIEYALNPLSVYLDNSCIVGEVEQIQYWRFEKILSNKYLLVFVWMILIAAGVSWPSHSHIFKEGLAAIIPC